MFSTGQHQRRMRNPPLKHPNGCQHTTEQDFRRYYNSTSQPLPENVCPQRFASSVRGFDGLDYVSTPAYYEDQAEFHNFGYRSCLPGIPGYPAELSSLDVAKMQIQHLLMQRHFGTGLDGFLTPPGTAASSSLSTSYPQGASPPDSAYSPSPSDDFESLRSHGSISNFDFKVPPRGASASGYFAPDERSYERGAMYTAEDVHIVVKNNRDGSRRRVVSNKVFVGGISHSMNREIINTFFGKFGTVFVDWPVKQRNNNDMVNNYLIPVHNNQLPLTSYSYLFLVYSEEQSVEKLMDECEQRDNNFFVAIPGCRETIQIRPWFIKNAFYIDRKARNTRCIDVHRTVFVGGLPRIVTAEGIAKMFSEFGKVLLVTIDIDQDYGYPKGAARVTFKRDSSFNRALERKYLKFKNIDSSKTLIEIKPYVMEDVGCDQCGGLWFNPFLDIYDQLQGCKREKPVNNKAFNMWRSNEQKTDSNTRPFDSGDLFSRIDAGYHNNLNSSDFSISQENHDSCNTENEVETGARKFLETTRAFGLDKQQTVNVLGTDYDLGPNLWYKFLPSPSFDMGNDMVQMNADQKIESFLRMKRANVYSNKSSYCKERPCRQYYCPSCSNNLHSGPDQHVLLPAGKPERRPRKDKNMYLVSLNN